MKKRIIFPAAALAVLLLLTMSLVAHPHFNKTVTAKLPSGVDAAITYNTTPANESHVTKAAVGSFLNPRRPTLKLAGELKAGSVTIPAGDYIIGVIKIGENDFTMALYPGQIPRGESADMSKMIKLESMFTTSAGKAEHMLIDITPGSDKFEGRAVLTLHFGSLFLAGALS